SRTGAWSQGAIKKRVKQGTGRERKGYKRKFPKYWGQRDGGLRKVLFAYDKSSATVVVGSLRFRNQTRRIRFKDRIFTTTPIGKTVPQLINEGGRARVTEIYKSGAVLQFEVKYRSFPYVSSVFPAGLQKFKEFARTEKIKRGL
ncbi:MAG: hypothetical protein ACPGLY_27455, partial [Rubripirellula sp.]